MKIPDFLYTKHIGLEIQEHVIRAVVVGKFFQSIRIIAWSEETLSEDMEPAWAIQDAKNRLFDRLCIKNPNVSIHLEGKNVRYQCFTIEGEDADIDMDWLNSQIQNKLPHGMSLSELSYDFNINKKDENFLIQLAYSKPDIIIKQVDILDSIDVNPITISPGRLDIILPYLISDSSNMNQNICFYEILDDRHSVIITENGIPVISQQFVSDNLLTADQVQQNIKFLFSERTMKFSELGKLYLINNQDEKFFEELKEALPLQVHSESLLSQNFSVSNSFDDKYSLATGLALKSAFTNLNPLNLLPVDRQIINRNKQEKDECVRNILIIGLIILIISLCLTGIKQNFEIKHENLQNDVFLLNDRIQKIEQIQKELKELQYVHIEMSKMVHTKTHYAQILSDISQHIPNGVWLSNLLTDSEKSKKRQVPDKQYLILKGWALDEKKLTLFIERLEESKYYKKIQLVETLRITTKSKDKTLNIEKPLVQFEIKNEIK